MKGSKIAMMALAVLCVAATAFAAEHGGGGEHHLNWNTLWIRLVNFAIFVFIIYKAGGKQIATFFRDRRYNIETELNDLEQRKADTARKLQDVEKSIANLEAEKAQILEDYKAQGEALKASIVAKANEQAEKTKQQAQTAAAAEARLAVEGLREEMAEMVVEATQKLLAEKLTADEQDKLIDKYLTKVVFN